MTFAPEVLGHLGLIHKKYHGLIRRAITQRLSHMPDQVSWNKKPLEEGRCFGSTWELRFGPQNQFRVFYEIDHAQHEVVVLAIGIKERNRLFIGGKEIQ